MATQKKSSKDQRVKITKYRGFKIREVFNRKTRRREFKARFQINNKEFRPVDENLKNLKEIIDEILVQERRAKFNLDQPEVLAPLMIDLLDIHEQYLERSDNRKKYNEFKRTRRVFENCFPADLKITKLKKTHFQKYIDRRSNHISQLTKQPVLKETINKELSAISVCLKRAEFYFAELEDIVLPRVPKIKVKKRRRERLVKKNDELYKILAYLRRSHKNPNVEKYRKSIADDLEFKYETGMRRKEVARLKWSNFDESAAALINIKRFKTSSITKFFPLSMRAFQIIISRRKNKLSDEFIFTADGEPVAAVYRTLKKICKTLKIPYGQFTDGGFVPHDLRHNFATEIIQATDIETAKTLTGHTGDHILTYLHTDESKLRDAVRRREGTDIKKQLSRLYKAVQNDNITVSEFTEKIENLFGK